MSPTVRWTLCELVECTCICNIATHVFVAIWYLVKCIGHKNVTMPTTTVQGSEAVSTCLWQTSDTLHTSSQVASALAAYRDMAHFFLKFILYTGESEETK